MLKPLSFLIIILCLLNCNNNSELDKLILKNQIRKEILDSIKQANSSKIVLHNFKLKKGNKILIYNNKTWEYKNSTKSKPLKTQALGFSQAVTKSKIKKQTKTTSNYSASSGYCGHPTKSGGNCRRKVKSGGYCWQHS